MSKDYIYPESRMVIPAMTAMRRLAALEEQVANLRQTVVILAGVIAQVRGGDDETSQWLVREAKWEAER